MKKIMELMVLVVLSCGLAGCFQIEQVVTVLPDGSGSVEETFMISRKIAESMAALAGGMNGQPGENGTEKAAPKEQSFFKDDEIRKRAGSFGPDVRFVRMERTGDTKFEGYRAVYSFSDINTLRLDQGSPGMPAQAAQGSDAPPKGTRFVFTPGKTATLVVKQPKKSAAAAEQSTEAAPPAKEATPEELAMVRQMFDGLRVSTKIVIKGKIVDSNASHRVDSTITLAEIDFGKMLDKPELLARMPALQNGDQAAAMEMLKKFPGMKVDLNDELKISFR